MSKKLICECCEYSRKIKWIHICFCLCKDCPIKIPLKRNKEDIDKCPWFKV
jgi:hypothetical protein